MYISITDPCISYVNNVIVNQKAKEKYFFLRRGGGASEIRQTWGGACPKRLKTPGLLHDLFVRRNENTQVKSSHLYLYSAFNNTNCVKATAQYQNRKIVSIM